MLAADMMWYLLRSGIVKQTTYTATIAPVETWTQNIYVPDNRRWYIFGIELKWTTSPGTWYSYVHAYEPAGQRMAYVVPSNSMNPKHFPSIYNSGGIPIDNLLPLKTGHSLRASVYSPAGVVNNTDIRLAINYVEVIV